MHDVSQEFTSSLFMRALEVLLPICATAISIGGAGWIKSDSSYKSNSKCEHIELNMAVIVIEV